MTFFISVHCGTFSCDLQPQSTQPISSNILFASIVTTRIMNPFQALLDTAPQRLAAGLILTGSVLTIAGAFFFEKVLFILPCPLCLEQRIPYYIAILVSAALLASELMAMAVWRKRLALAVLALVLAYGSGLGVYHAGAEWGFWAGPTSCAQAGTPTLASGADLLKALQTTKVISCTEVQWRFLGLSLAGYNVLIAGALAMIAAVGAARSPR